MSQPPRKRRMAALACNRCRQRKIACDTARPTCVQCSRHNAVCTYAYDIQEGESRRGAQQRDAGLARSRLDTIESAFQWLKTLDEHQAIGIFQDMLRADGGPIDALTLLASGTARSILPAVDDAASTVLPYMRPTLSEELATLHPISYPVLVPVEQWTAYPNGPALPERIESFLAPDAEQIVLPSATRPISLALGHSMNATSSRNGLGGGEGHQRPFRLEAAESRDEEHLCDPRLEDLSISAWTSIPIPSTYAANVISRYLATDHPILGFFDADLFVQDLIDGRSEFCSPLLVSAVLYWGCQMYATVDPQSYVWGFRFLAEAKRRWAEEGNKRSILAVASGYILSLGLKCYCNDNLSGSFMEEATRTAVELRLLGVSKSAQEIESDDRMPSDKYRATAHIAWGAYNWLALMAHYYGTDVPALSPSFRIPGEQESERPIDGPPPSPPLPYMVQTFTALCQLRRIHTKALIAYNTRGHIPLLNRISLQFAEDTFKEMLDWADKLGSLQVRGQYATNHVLLLHIWYHAMVLQLFRPFLGRQIPLRAFTAFDGLPEKVFAASLEQLKALAVTYHRLQPSAMYTILWHISLLDIGNSVLSNAGHPDWRFFFLLCINAYQDLSKCFRVAAGFMQGLLWLATRSRLISAQESTEILDQFFQSQSQDLRTLRSSHIVNLNLAARDIDAAENVTTAVEKLEALSIKGIDESRP